MPDKRPIPAVQGKHRTPSARGGTDTADTSPKTADGRSTEEQTRASKTVTSKNGARSSSVSRRSMQYSYKISYSANNCLLIADKSRNVSLGNKLVVERNSVDLLVLISAKLTVKFLQTDAVFTERKRRVGIDRGHYMKDMLYG